MAKGTVALLKGKIDVDAVIAQLNAALSEEWLAYYQYWTAAAMVEGPSREDIKDEFLKHAKEELDHAQRVIDRIIELDGVPVMMPSDWDKYARCKYERPTSYTTEYFLKAIAEAERCAMWRYQEIAEFTEGKDYVTNDLAKKILAEEVDHEQDMTDFIRDIEVMHGYLANKPLPEPKPCGCPGK